MGGEAREKAVQEAHILQLAGVQFDATLQPATLQAVA